MRIQHIAIAVNDLDAALNFYEHALGLTVTERREVPEEGVEIAFLPAGESLVELLRPLDPENTIGQYLARRGEGMHHICFSVPDVEAAAARLTEAGAQLIGGIKTNAHGIRYCFIHPKSSRGVLIELYEEG